MEMVECPLVRLESRTDRPGPADDPRPALGLLRLTLAVVTFAKTLAAQSRRQRHPTRVTILDFELFEPLSLFCGRQFDIGCTASPMLFLSRVVATFLAARAFGLVCEDGIGEFVLEQ